MIKKEIVGFTAGNFDLLHPGYIITFEEAKKAFIESTGLDSSITGAISFYGRHTDSSCPTANQLLQMVDNLQTDRAKKEAVIDFKIELRNKELEKLPHVEVPQYYPKRG